jgi:hypothetical protein
MWGRVYNASRSALGQERAKKMIAICDQAHVQRLDTDREFQITLQVVEGEVDGDGDYAILFLYSCVPTLSMACKHTNFAEQQGIAEFYQRYHNAALLKSFQKI